jgi:hypothetical protein
MPSPDTAGTSHEKAQFRPAGDMAAGVVEKFTLPIERGEGCRKQAEAQHLNAPGALAYAGLKTGSSLMPKGATLALPQK